MADAEKWKWYEYTPLWFGGRQLRSMWHNITGDEPLPPLPGQVSQVQPQVGRQPIGALAQQAQEQTMSAVRADVNRQLVEALGRSDIAYAQRGMFRSGSALGARGELEQAAARDIAAESARASLQRLGLVTQYDLAQQQMQMQKEAGEAAMWGSIMEGIAPLLLMQLFPPAAAAGGGSNLMEMQILQYLLGQQTGGGMSP
jgi:hypothetical protein